MLTKILFTVAILIVVGYAWSMVRKLNRARDAAAGRADASERVRLRRRWMQPRRIEAEDLVKCGACGSYVAARGARACGRGDCPNPA